MTFLVSSHRWVEAHAGEITYFEDKRAKNHPKRLLAEAELLKQILRVL